MLCGMPEVQQYSVALSTVNSAATITVGDDAARLALNVKRGQVVRQLTETGDYAFYVLLRQPAAQPYNWVRLASAGSSDANAASDAIDNDSSVPGDSLSEALNTLVGRLALMEAGAYDSIKVSERADLDAFIASPDVDVQAGDGVLFTDGSVCSLKDGGELATKAHWIVVRDANGTYVPSTRTVNGKPLTGNIALSLSDVTTAGTLGTELLAKNKETGSNYALLATGGTTQTKALEIPLGFTSTGTGALVTQVVAGTLTVSEGDTSVSLNKYGLVREDLALDAYASFGQYGLLSYDSVRSVRGGWDVVTSSALYVSEGSKLLKIGFSGITLTNAGIVAGAVFHADGTTTPVAYSPLSGKPDLTTKEDKSAKGAPNGYAPLGADGKVPAQYLPANSLYGGTVA